MRLLCLFLCFSFLLFSGCSIGEIDSALVFEMSILDEINLARSNPKAYFDNYIAPQKNKFSAAYFNSCKQDMYSAGSLGRLSFQEGLYKVSKDHVNTQGPAGTRGHDRTDGRAWQTAISEYGSYYSVGENISYGKNTAQDIVIQLLVDDGVPSLGHRKNILNPVYDSAGCAYGTHKTYRYMCVINFAKNWRDK